jgi:hypothetical protein
MNVVRKPMTVQIKRNEKTNECNNETNEHNSKTRERNNKARERNNKHNERNIIKPINVMIK